MSVDVIPQRILWIAPKFPLGSPDGARHATVTLIRSLVRRGAEIRLVCLVPEGEPADPGAARRELGVESCSIIPRSASRFLPVPGPGTPFTFRTFADPRVRATLRREAARLLGAAGESHVLFDGLHAFAALNGTELSALSQRTRGLIYRAHNVETELWEQCAARARWPRSVLLRRQAALVRTFETRVARTAGIVAPVSEDDRRRFQTMAPGARITVVPIGMDFPDEAAVQPVALRAELALLFIGRLDWLPNREGLRWFLDEVWPALKAARPGVSLRIAGTGDGRWLEPYRGRPGVELLGRAEDLRPLYESCALTIAPLFTGSGTRVKILEASRYARPVVSTALGAEGLGLSPGRAIHLAETRDEWLSILTAAATEDYRRMGLAAFREARALFDAGAAAGKLLGSLEGALVLA